MFGVLYDKGLPMNVLHSYEYIQYRLVQSTKKDFFDIELVPLKIMIIAKQNRPKGGLYSALKEFKEGQN